MRYWIGLCLLVVSVAVFGQFRCQGKIISKNDSEYRVKKLCGKPSTIEEWTAVETEFESAYPTPWGRDKPAPRPSMPADPAYERPVYVSVQYSRWTYDLGSTQFIKYLLFRNKILQSIDEGDYGN